MTDSTISTLKERLNQLKQGRSNYDNTYQDISKFINPNRNDFVTKQTIGARRFDRIYDTTGIDANRSLASALTNSITNPQSKWVNMVTRKGFLMTDDNVRAYLSIIENTVLATFNSTNSGFYQQNHQMMLDLPAYGTAAMFIEDTPLGVVFKAIPLSQLYIEENAKGAIDTVFRRFQFTARQILQQWGDTISEEDSRKLKEEINKKFDVVHVVMPKEDFESSPEIGFKDGKDFGSVYYIEDPAIILNTGSFFDQPYIVARWEKLTGEIYGRGSGWNAIADIQTLNVMGESGLRSVQQSSSPAYLVPDDGVLTSVRSVPGGVTVGGLNEDGVKMVQQLDFNPRLDYLEAEKETRRDAVRKAFFVDRFERKEGTPVTATENLDNQQVRLVLAAPQIFRVESEYLTPLIDRVFGVLERKGEIPPAPAILEGQIFDYEYQSPIIKAQRRQELLAANIAVESMGPILAENPDLLDLIDGESLFRENLSIAGVPIRHLRTEEEYTALEQAKIEAEQEAQEQQQQQELANTAANLQKSGIDVTGEE